MRWLYKCIEFAVRKPGSSVRFITPLENPTTEVLLGEQGYSNLNQVVSEAQKLISYADPTLARRVAAPAYAEHTSGSSRTEGGIF
jgi:hypothetical protein